MGPYCRYCNQRCFCYLPEGTPPEALEAYGTSTIIATCPAGQAFEKQEVGWCYADITAYIAEQAKRQLMQDVLDWMGDALSSDGDEWDDVTIPNKHVMAGDDLMNRLAVVLGHMSQAEADAEKSSRDARMAEVAEYEW